jgi:hypothetical protein
MPVEQEQIIFGSPVNDSAGISMFPLVPSERDFPRADILAMHNDEVYVVIFEHSRFHLVYDSPHAPPRKKASAARITMTFAL